MEKQPSSQILLTAKSLNPLRNFTQKMLTGIAYSQSELRGNPSTTAPFRVRRWTESSIPAGETEFLTAATLFPKTSTVIYQAERFRPDAFQTVLPDKAEVPVWWKNSAEQVLVFVVKRPEELDWARTKDVTHLIYDLYIVFYDAARKLLFIHSSVKSTHLQLARAIGGTVTQVRGENMFRLLGGIERTLL